MIYLTIESPPKVIPYGANIHGNTPTIRGVKLNGISGDKSAPGLCEAATAVSDGTDGTEIGHYGEPSKGSK